MRIYVFVSASALALAACNAPPVPETTPVPDLTATEPATRGPTTSEVTVDGLPFRVQVNADRQTALVRLPTRRGSYTGRDIETAARQATGCAATIVPGEWSFLDLTSIELNNLRPNVMVPFPAWPVALSCGT